MIEMHTRTDPSFTFLIFWYLFSNDLVNACVVFVLWRYHSNFRLLINILNLFLYVLFFILILIQVLVILLWSSHFHIFFVCCIFIINFLVQLKKKRNICIKKNSLKLAIITMVNSIG